LLTLLVGIFLLLPSFVLAQTTLSTGTIDGTVTDPSGAVVSGAGLQEAIFANQGDAESWLGENWRELLDSGVDQVTLLDDTRKQYGPMSLHPEG